MVQGWYVLTHGGVVPGRERFAASLLAKGADLWGTQKGKLTPVTPMFLMPGSGPRDHMAFMSMYSGTLTDLQTFITSEPYERFWAAAAQVLKNLSGRLYGIPRDADELARIMKGAADEWRNMELPGA